MLTIGYCRCHDDGHDGIGLGIGPGDDPLSQDRKVQELRKVRYLRSSARGCASWKGLVCPTAWKVPQKTSRSSELDLETRAWRSISIFGISNKLCIPPSISQPKIEVKGLLNFWQLKNNSRITAMPDSLPPLLT